MAPPLDQRPAGIRYPALARSANSASSQHGYAHPQPTRTSGSDSMGYAWMILSVRACEYLTLRLGVGEGKMVGG